MAEERVVDFRGRGTGEPRDPDMPAPDCPIVALGQLDGHYWFLSPSGELRELEKRELAGDVGMLSLFDGQTDYLKFTWPRFDKDGRRLDDFNPRAARQGLIAMAAEAGLWDRETPVRGRGVWPLGRPGSGGNILCHAGQALFFGDGGGDAPKGEARAGQKLAGAIYPARPPFEPPATEPALAAEIAEWRRDFHWWRFAPLGLGGTGSDRGPDGLAADLLYCAVSLAMLGAAPGWRVHTLIKAVHGAGKSTLVAFGSASLGPQCTVMNNFSEAGLRNSLANEARAVWLDEAEGDDGETMGGVIRLIRQMSGGAGVQGARGTAEGGARRFEIAGCAFMAAINMPALLPQDLSRILVLEMLPGIPAHEAQAKAGIDRAAALSPRLRARALLGWPRFLANLAFLRAALLTRGCTSRQVDQLGSLLAAGAMMSDDRVIDPGAADDLAESVVPLIETMQAEEADAGDALRCWRLLLTRRVDAWRSGEMQTVASLLATAQGSNAVATRRLLDEVCGLRLVLSGASASMPEAPCLYVAKQHAFLREAYRDTPQWREGGWAHSLARLDGAAPARFPVRIFRVKQRAIAVPLVHLPMARAGPSSAHEGGVRAGGAAGFDPEDPGEAG